MDRRTLLTRASYGTAAACIPLGLVASLPTSAHAQVTDLNDAINKAGRQRMLSQRMGKAWLALAHKADTPAARTVLQQSMALFEKQLAELKAYAPSPAIRDTYAQLEAAWGAHRALLLGTQAPSRDGAAALLAADAKVLALAHQGTVQYEAASGKPVGHLVNVAGRQRMLSQRMAKFCLAALLSVDTATATTEIAKARTEFLAAQDVLREAPQATVRVRQELQLADGQWVFFDAALQRMEPGGANAARQVAEVFVASENLLSSMDRVTGLYAALGAA
ncbi:type IV pili methyl-accepting chemotaxis transducer N-terminal domain-containing protein [Acidovorax sp.]|uniref:type IV pili methyl-accepting chemotaxis transducer N-terminal domain-containing protein n=1 Tax=Acidovorax sp. TaxID=1872122 RepID=UPI00391B081C